MDKIKLKIIMKFVKNMNFKNIGSYSFLFIIIFCGKLTAAEKEFDKILDFMITNNRELFSINQMISGKKEKVISEKSFDAPSVGVEYFSNKSAMFSLSWMYPFPGKLSLKGNATNALVKETEFLYEKKKIYLSAALKRNIIEYYSITELIKEQKDIIEVMNSFLKKMKSEYITGMIPQSNILTMQIELKKMKNMLIMYEADKKESLLEIKSILSTDKNYTIPMITYDEIKSLMIPMEEIQNITIDKNPELSAIKANIEYLSLAVNLMKKEKYPDFMLTGKTGTMNEKSIMASINLPFLTRKTGANIKLMEFEKTEKELMYESMRIEINNMLSSMLISYQAKKEILESYEDYIFNESTNEISLYEAGYRAGKSTFLDVLSADKRYIENRMEYSNILKDLAKILSEIEILSGKIYGLK